MARKKKKKRIGFQPTIDVSRGGAKGAASRSRQAEIDVITARSKLNVRGLVSAKQAKEGLTIDPKTRKLVKKEEEAKKEIKIPLPQEGQTLEEKKVGPTGLISQRPLTEEEKSLREPQITDQPKIVQSFQKTLLAITQTGVSPRAITGLGGVLKGPAKLAISNPGRTIIGGLAGTSGIMTWLANDNIISGMTIFTRDLRNAVTFGQMSADEALVKMDEAQETVDLAAKFINTQTAVNPLLWPFRGIILANVEAANRVLDNNREIISGIVLPEEETITQEIPNAEDIEML